MRGFSAVGPSRASFGLPVEGAERAQSATSVLGFHDHLGLAQRPSLPRRKFLYALSPWNLYLFVNVDVKYR